MENFTDSGIWFLALFILFGMGGNGFGGGGRNATVEDLNTSANFTRLESQVRDNAGLTERKTDAIANGLSSLGYDLASKFGNVDKEILDSKYATSQQIDQAKSEILGVIAQNKIESLQAQVSELKTQNMFCGIPRINPYGYGVYPYSGCGCNGNI